MHLIQIRGTGCLSIKSTLIIRVKITAEKTTISAEYSQTTRGTHGNNGLRLILIYYCKLRGSFGETDQKTATNTVVTPLFS